MLYCNVPGDGGHAGFASNKSAKEFHVAKHVDERGKVVGDMLFHSGQKGDVVGGKFPVRGLFL